MLFDRLLHLLDYFIPKRNRNDKKVYNQSQLLVAGHLISLVFLIPFVLLHLHIEYMAGVAALSLTFSVALVDLFIFRRFGSCIFSGNLIVLGGFSGFIILIATSGGILSPTVPWLITVALTGFLFANRFSGYFWSVLSLLSILAFFFLRQASVAFEVQYPEKYQSLHFVATFLGVSIYIVLIVLIYEILNERIDRRLRAIINQVSEKNRQMQAQQAELSEKTAELEKLSIAAGKTDNAVIIMNAQGDFEWFNEGFTRLYGYTFEEFTQMKSSNILATATTMEAIQAINRSIREKKTQIYESLMIHKNGDRLWVQTTITPVLGKEGELTNLVAIDADISRLRDAETEILRQKEEIEKQKAKIEHQHEILKSQKQAITNSILYARRIQAAILPPQEVFSQIFPKHFVFFRPRDIVSGDFYWLAQRKNLSVIISADCTGHGVPGAFMSMLGIALLNEIVSKNQRPDAAEILNELRSAVKEALRQTGKMHEAKDGMDLALCIVDWESLAMQFAGAYSPLYVIRQNPENNPLKIYDKPPLRPPKTLDAQGAQLTQIDADRMPIGIHIKEQKSFTKHHVQLQRGDMLYLFSDGYVDQFGEKSGTKFMTKPFKRFLLKIHRKPLAAQKQALAENFDRWKGKTHQVDDVMVIGIKI